MKNTTVVNPFDKKKDTSRSNAKTLLLAKVADFINRYEAPPLNKISESQTKGFIREFLEDRLEYNLLTQEVELDGKSINRHGADSLSIENRMLVVCEDEHNSTFVSKPLFKRHLLDTIDRNNYHPVEKYLKGLSSTDPVRIDNLAERYLGNSSKLANLLLKKTLIAAVARMFDPGCEVHSVLILFSPQQGIGKSSFLKTLAKERDWFNDTVPKISVNKDLYLKLHQHWLTEIGEIDTKFRRNQEDEIKDFITSSKDSFRPAYTKKLLKCRRRFILTGTTNNGSFLRDQTGSRRYWIVPVKDKINISALEKEVDGIWAAAVQAYNNGEPWHLNEEEEKMLEQSNASFTYDHLWYPAIKHYLDEHKNDEFILPKNIAEISSLGISKKEITKPNSKAIKEIRNLLRQKFHYNSKKISSQQRQALFNKLSGDPNLKPQVEKIDDIPHSIWVKFDDFFDDDRAVLHESDLTSQPSSETESSLK